jgi:uncharacterized protein (TIGR00251 family)
VIVALEQTSQGVIIPVRVHAAAHRNAIVGVHDGALRIDVTAAPEKGKANLAVARVLSTALDAPRSAVTLVSGATGTKKRFLATGLTLQQVSDRLAELLD